VVAVCFGYTKTAPVYCIGIRRMKMKSLKSAIAAVLLLSAASGSAFAYHGGGGYHGGHHGSRVGVYIGAPVLGFGYPYPYYGYPGYGYEGYGVYGPSTTIVTTPAQPPVYIEQQSAATTGPASDGNWYYCHNPDGYYPYVKQCADGWQRIPAQPVQR
jgi:hypothetical protein